MVLPDTPPEEVNLYKKYIPRITALCCAASIILWIGINTERNFETWDAYRKWGAPSPDDIWNGAYWGLITTNFLHVTILHITFNLYWFWRFGKKIEFESSIFFYIAFILSAGLISSITELAFSETTGIGLSGIGYAFFGFLLVKRNTEGAYANFIDKRIVFLFIIWLLLCYVLTLANIYQVGNAAHIGGFLWGLLIAKISKYKKRSQLAISTAVLAVFSITIFWNPWSIEWLSNKAYNLHKEQKLDEAKVLYRKILVRDKDNELAKVNLKIIIVDSLSKAAYSAHNNEDYHEALRLYKEILEMDPDNKWAKENMDMLPVK